MVPDSTAEEGYKIEGVSPDYEFWVSADSIKLGETEIEVPITIPSKQELAMLAIKTLQERQKTVMANAYDEKQRIQGKIDALMMLEHNPEN